jgi:hypothetical protein
MLLVTVIRKKHDVPKITLKETKVPTEYSLRSFDAVHLTEFHSVCIGIT